MNFTSSFIKSLYNSICAFDNLMFLPLSCNPFSSSKLWNRLLNPIHFLPDSCAINIFCSPVRLLDKNLVLACNAAIAWSCSCFRSPIHFFRLFPERLRKKMLNACWGWHYIIWIACTVLSKDMQGRLVNG